jgi:hypothetical protein
MLGGVDAGSTRLTDRSGGSPFEDDRLNAAEPQPDRVGTGDGHLSGVERSGVHAHLSMKGAGRRVKLDPAVTRPVQQEQQQE